MRGDAGSWARSALVAALAACVLLGLQSLPIASAAKGASEAGSRAAHRAERAAAKAEDASPPPPASTPADVPAAPPAAPAHGRHGQPSPGAATPATPGAGASAGAGAHKGERSAAHGQRREERRAGSGSSSLASSAGQGAAEEESSTAQAEALAAKQKKGGGQKGKKEHKGKGKKAEEPQPEGTGGEGSSATSAKSKSDLAAGAGEAQATAAAASATAPVSAPSSGLGTVATGPSTVAAKSEPAAAGSATRKGARRARRSHKTRAAGATRPAAVPASSALTAPAGAVSTATARSGHSATGPVRKRSTQPAIVKTLTKIVGVVPTPVWVLIAGLIVLALLLGVRSLLTGVRTRRLVRQRGQLLEDVGLLQAALLPVPPDRLGPVATSVAYRPADGPGAGGDFYDVFALEDGEIAVIVGDVSGHGREALPHTALVRFTVRAYLEAGLSPRRALQTAGTVLERQLAGSFATVIAATYNPRKRTLTYASAGHPPPVVLGEDGGAARTLRPVTSCSAPPVGAGMPTGTRQTVVSVPGPARLCFHTDGVTEARVAGELFGAERLGAALAGLPREADATALLERVAEQSDARPDDMAACLLRVHDGHGAPATALEQLELSRELMAGDRVERFLTDCGLEPAEAQALVRDARLRLQRLDTLMLELERSADGRTIASLAEDNVIHAAALATAGVS